MYLQLDRKKGLKYTHKLLFEVNYHTLLANFLFNSVATAVSKGNFNNAGGVLAN